jgi:hypothetical protein
MAVNYKELYRIQEYSVDAKKVITKAFEAAEVAAAAANNVGITDNDLNQIVAGKLDAIEEHDFRILFDGIRAACSADDNTFDISPYWKGNRWDFQKESFMRNASQAVVDLLSTP